MKVLIGVACALELMIATRPDDELARELPQVGMA